MGAVTDKNLFHRSDRNLGGHNENNMSLTCPPQLIC